MLDWNLFVEVETAVKVCKKVYEKLYYLYNLAQISMPKQKLENCWDVKAVDPSSPILLELGSYGLNVLHGAYQNSQFKTD